MGKIGRNDPCPCGSGKKYKKCCLGTPRDPAALPPKEPPARVNTTRNYNSEVHDALEEILVTAKWAFHEDNYCCFDDLCAQLNLHPSEVARTKASSAIVYYCALGSELLSREQSYLRDDVFDRLQSDAAKSLYSQMLKTPLRVWDIQSGWWGSPRTWTTMLGPRKNVQEVIAASFGLGKTLGDDRLVGWLLHHDTQSIFLGMWRLRPEGLRALERAAKSLPQKNDNDFWKTLAPDLLRSIVDPKGLNKLERPRAESARSAKTPEAGQAGGLPPAHRDFINRSFALSLTSAWKLPIRFQKKGWELSEIRWFREQVASALTADERERVMGMIRLGLEQNLRKMRSGFFTVDLPKCINLEEAIAPFGLRTDGAFALLDEEALQRRPLSLLMLPDDHPIWADVHPFAPMRIALVWAENHAGTGTVAAVETAYKRYLMEERWLETCRSGDSNQPSRRITPAYEEIRHALAELFHPAAIDVPLSIIDVDRASFSRLIRALPHAAGRPEPERGWHIRDLPEDSFVLLETTGYAKGTHDRVADGLLAYARIWRARCAGIDPAELDRLDAPPKARETLREGLDEIASLFELP